MIRVRIKDTGVISAVNGLINDLTEVATMGTVMKFAANAIWIPKIESRLFNNETSTSNYEAHLYQSMKDLSPNFVRALGNATGWADVMEWERRNRGGGYKEGEVTSAIARVLRVSQAMKVGGVLAVGIGDLEELQGATIHLDGDSKYKLWQILQWGTGEYAGKGKILRVGKQIFYNENMTSFADATEHGILAYQTKSPGFKGREYFVQLDGTMHESDLVTKAYILNYINNTIKKWSYKGKSVRGR